MPASSRRTPLSRERIIDVAVRVADREGVEAVTMRRLAEILKVHPTSIYNHLESKDAILAGVVERLFEEAALPERYDDWSDWVRAFSGGLRTMAAKHPGAFLVLLRRTADGPIGARQAEAGLDAFRRGGFNVARSTQAVVGVALTALGLALGEAVPTGPTETPEPSDVDLANLPRLEEASAGFDDYRRGVWDVVVGALVAGLGDQRLTS